MLRPGERVIIRRSPNDVRLVENPSSMQWRNLAEKLHWAATPRYRGARSEAAGTPPRSGRRTGNPAQPGRR